MKVSPTQLSCSVDNNPGICHSYSLLPC